jgi:hypothetical protein
MNLALGKPTQKFNDKPMNNKPKKKFGIFDENK